MESELRPPKLIQNFIIKYSKGIEIKEKHNLNIFSIDGIIRIMKKTGFYNIKIKGENTLQIIASK